MKIAAITPNGKQDYLTESILIGLYELKCEIKATDSGNSLSEKYCLNDKDFVKYAKEEADAVLVFFGKVRNNNPPKCYLLDKINKPNITAYIDGSEWTSTGNPNKDQVKLAKNDSKLRKGEPWINKDLLHKSKFYFKRECYLDDYAIGIIPLPFAAKYSSKWYSSNEKKYDIFCSFGQTNDGLRKEVEDYLKTKNFNLFSEKNIPHDKFIKNINMSKIAIDAWGGGDCCARFYEIAINETCPVYQKYNILVPYPYTDMVNCVEYSTINELNNKLEYLLANEEKLIDITKKCYQHTLQYHITKARSKYMLEKMGFII